ncbi:MAG: coproporphyrinogen oxidase [Bacillales bacterium]|nr:coproporphyrinogen oxidase [Bacillales bacterium]
MILLKIFINGITEEHFLTSIRNICKLFFDELELTKNKEDGHKLELLYNFSNKEVECRLNSFDLSHEFSKMKFENSENRHTYRQNKTTAIKKATLKVLESFTQTKQPWGILTGIRPTKLYHKYKQEGMNDYEVSSTLKENKFLDDEKIILLESIVERQLKSVKDLYTLNNEVSIYIGIPYCPTKCAYCTFPAYLIPKKGNEVQDFFKCLLTEIEAVGNYLSKKKIKVTTVYLGGGTPTSLNEEQLTILFAKLYDWIPNMSSIRELTVEAGRPDTITKVKLDVLNKFKVTRISVNPQSFNQETLDAIGRHHTVNETIEKYELARANNFTNINMDLIIGLPNEGVDELKFSLEQMSHLQPESVTIHTLSFKRASQMSQNKDKYTVASSTEIINMMELAKRWAQENNYEPYYLYRQKNILGNLENIGYAKKGKESIYNILIMEEAQTIIGIGCGAASKFISKNKQTIEHFANPKDTRSYMLNLDHYIQEKCKLIDEYLTD